MRSSFNVTPSKIVIDGNTVVLVALRAAASVVFSLLSSHFLVTTVLISFGAMFFLPLLTMV
jgi:hypothetical protein